MTIFEAFAIFCGLGIHNTQMYENACKLMAKQKVALECLSYHATAPNDDTERLSKDDIPTADHFNLYRCGHPPRGMRLWNLSTPSRAYRLS